VAAPIFKRIAQAALLQTGVRPSVDPAPVLLAGADTPSLPEPVDRTSFVPTLASVGGLAVMPDVTGLSARSATRVLSGLGLDVRASGSGIVTAQTPEPGSPIDAGAISSIHLERFGAGRDDSKGVR
jgi:hypothetical protein